jgi:hypothetical protein
MSLDIYVWLAWRLHRLTKVTSISWPAHAQFGTGFKAVRQFKPRFTDALEAALAASYPEARVDLGDKAITLHPARPADRSHRLTEGVT